MITFVPYLTEDHIEREAVTLLSEFSHARGTTLVPPIPIEDITEKHLKLTLEFDNTHDLFGIPREPGQDPDILGAIYFDDRRIVIDESLDPEEFPNKEGRYRYTLAHEAGGHWRLHHHLFAPDLQVSFFAEPAQPSVICRKSQAKERIEWQADYYAACLLMPRSLVIDAWNEMCPDGKCRVLTPAVPTKHPFVEIHRAHVHTRDAAYFMETEDHALEQFVRPLAKRFAVSPTAMRIRLEQLGFLLRSVPRQQFLVDP